MNRALHFRNPNPFIQQGVMAVAAVVMLSCIAMAIVACVGLAVMLSGSASPSHASSTVTGHTYHVTTPPMQGWKGVGSILDHTKQAEKFLESQASMENETSDYITLDEDTEPVLFGGRARRLERRQARQSARSSEGDDDSEGQQAQMQYAVIPYTSPYAQQYANGYKAAADARGLPALSTAQATQCACGPDCPCWQQLRLLLGTMEKERYNKQGSIGSGPSESANGGWKVEDPLSPPANPVANPITLPVRTNYAAPQVMVHYGAVPQQTMQPMMKVYTKKMSCSRRGGCG